MTEETKKKEAEPKHKEEHHHEHPHAHHQGHGHCACAGKAHAHEESLHKLKEEASEFKDKYLRALAEIENSRKRLTKEKYESQSLVMQEVISSFLDPLDQMEQALQHASKAKGDVQVWAKGFEMLLQQFQQVLESYNVVSFSALGSLFDPHVHEALEVEERSDVPEGTVLHEFKKGYKMGQKTVRPAKVRVSKLPVPSEAGTKEESGTKEKLNPQESVVRESEQPQKQQE